MEFQSARIFTNSLGLQAVLERTLAEANSMSSRNNGSMPGLIDAADYGFVQEVVDGSLETLKLAIRLAERNVLMHAPVRIFLRITIASIHLLKGLSVGVGASKLRTSLDILTRCIAGLRSSSPDDMHLGSSYATLLEMHVDQLRARFMRTDRPHNFATRGSTPVPETMLPRDNDASVPQGEQIQEVADASGVIMSDAADMDMFEEWLSLPFDSSLLPLVPEGTSQGFPWLGDTSLDFIWNLET